ncbi:MAG: Signal transduction response regulator, receiver region domain protein [Candidatus Syntrophoarchaeum caldarius]|uniref:Signal transduction response regulator, receiver region domain protein n=1 Tax=Candidatus Syntropharchaeum caldarium TaxID=1838285 RepID=A0A1F2P9G0_9EURY|nr:MAG: Signal transduction response regulator, receiver region domain protein [Candidatus Syntrophoarchaeum caldarius]
MAVDDDPRIREVLEMLFTMEGIDVAVASGGEEAIEILENEGENIDLLLLDIMMPKMDGWDVVRELQARGWTNRLLIAMLTAKGDPGDKAAGLDEYVFDYITKPFDPDELVRRVKDFLEVMDAAK